MSRRRFDVITTSLSRRMPIGLTTSFRVATLAMGQSWVNITYDSITTEKLTTSDKTNYNIPMRIYHEENLYCPSICAKTLTETKHALSCDFPLRTKFDRAALELNLSRLWDCRIAKFGSNSTTVTEVNNKLVWARLPYKLDHIYQGQYTNASSVPGVYASSWITSDN